MEDLKNETKWWVIVFAVLLVLFLLTVVLRLKKSKIAEQNSTPEQTEQLKQLKNKLTASKENYDKAQDDSWNKYLRSRLQTNKATTVGEKMDKETGLLLSRGQVDLKKEAYRKSKRAYEEAKNIVEKQNQAVDGGS